MNGSALGEPSLGRPSYVGKNLGKGDDVMDQNECAHPNCRCMVIPGIAVSEGGEDYCSDHCAKAGSQDTEKCECGHPGCA